MHKLLMFYWHTVTVCTYVIHKVLMVSVYAHGYTLDLCHMYMHEFRHHGTYTDSDIVDSESLLPIR